MIYGYARISRPQQSIDRQIRNIKQKYPEAKIISEAFTGTTVDRPKWAKLVRKVMPGDTIVFDSVSRMSRNAQEGFAVYEELFQRGVNLVFIKEPLIDTATFKCALETSVPMTGTSADEILKGVNRFLLDLARQQIKLSFDQSEKEVKDLRQRTQEGLETARLNGKQIGQERGNTWETKKSKDAKKIILKHAKAFGGSLTDKEVMRMAKISKNTFYKYKKELLSE